MPKDDLSVSLHDHLIKLLEDHERLQDEQLAAMDKALVLARTEAEKQYHALNNLRKEYQEERQMFLLESVYEGKHEALVTKIETLSERLNETRNWFKVWGAVIFALTVAFQLVGHFIWK